MYPLFVMQIYKFPAIYIFKVIVFLNIKKKFLNAATKNFFKEYLMTTYFFKCNIAKIYNYKVWFSLKSCILPLKIVFLSKQNIIMWLEIDMYIFFVHYCISFISYFLNVWTAKSFVKKIELNLHTILSIHMRQM